MANLAIPPPSRVAIGYTMVGGERQDVYLNIEWARYFESLNGQVSTVASAVGLPGAPGQTGAAGSSLAMMGDGDGSTEFIMVAGGGTAGAPGAQGPQGLQGPPIELSTDADNSVEFIPLAGAAGTPGAVGAPGPVLFVGEPESVSEFIPLAGPQGPQGVQGSGGSAGQDGAALFMLGDPDPPDVIPLPGPQGLQGITGNAGANGSALFMLGEADAPDPIVYPGPTGPAGATGPTGSVGAAGAALFVLQDTPNEDMPLQDGSKAPLYAPTFTGTVTAPKFQTAAASASALTGVATTVYALPNLALAALYLVHANIGNVADAVNYGAFAVIATDGSSARIVSNNSAPLQVINLSSLNIQCQQSSGSTQTIIMTVTRIG